MKDARPSRVYRPSWGSDLRGERESTTEASRCPTPGRRGHGDQQLRVRRASAVDLAIVHALQRSLGKSELPCCVGRSAIPASVAWVVGNDRLWTGIWIGVSPRPRCCRLRRERTSGSQKRVPTSTTPSRMRKGRARSHNKGPPRHLRSLDSQGPSLPSLSAIEGCSRDKNSATHFEYIGR